MHISSYILSLLAILILLHCYKSDVYNKDLHDPIIIALIGCGLKAKFHLPSFFASLLDQPTHTKARISLYLFGDHNVWTIFYNSGCLKSVKSNFHSLIYKNLSDYSKKWGGTLSILSKFWKLDNRYGCASFKLDLLNMIPDTVTRLIYMDIDTIIFEDLANLHDYFYLYPGKIMYLAMESYRENFGYYANSKRNRSGKTHYYQPTGVNSGVILMNLDLMRKLNPPLNAETLIRGNDEPITMGDQDLYNTWFYYYPHHVLILPCKWNRRSDSACTSGDTTNASNFKTARIWNGFDEFEQGGGILHANRRVFMRHGVYPRHYELHKNKTSYFYNIGCNLSHIQSGK